MDLHLSEWTGFLVRWIHLITGISWIGSSFYFMWLDASLEPPTTGKPDVEGELWMVHSGGFYEVERKKIGPGSMPKTLHWFKYEALFTWISGACLLGIVYYLNASAYLIDPLVMALTPGQAVGISVALIAGSWFVYDSIWQFIGVKFNGLASALSILLACSLALSFCKLFSGRAAFIHTGAMFGTWMVANVWVRILPAQQKMINATQEGRTPDYSLSGRAKRRSVHNTYMTFPVLFMMLSNHYPLAYAGHFNWVSLFSLIILGASVRHVMVAKEGKGIWAIGPAIMAAMTLVFLNGSSIAGGSDKHVVDTSPPVPFQKVQAIITSRCVACHSTQPTITTFGPTPGGIQFDSPQRIQTLAPEIKIRAVITKTMPFNNLTGITEEERQTLGHWIDQGAQLQ